MEPLAGSTKEAHGNDCSNPIFDGDNMLKIVNE